MIRRFLIFLSILCISLRFQFIILKVSVTIDIAKVLNDFKHILCIWLSFVYPSNSSKTFSWLLLRNVGFLSFYWFQYIRILPSCLVQGSQFICQVLQPFSVPIRKVLKVALATNFHGDIINWISLLLFVNLLIPFG